jgi:hypothetical protein
MFFRCFNRFSFKFLHFLSIYAVASKEHLESRLNSLPAFAEDGVSSFSFCSGFIDRRAVPKTDHSHHAHPFHPSPSSHPLSPLLLRPLSLLNTPLLPPQGGAAVGDTVYFGPTLEAKVGVLDTGRHTVHTDGRTYTRRCAYAQTHLHKHTHTHTHSHTHSHTHTYTHTHISSTVSHSSPIFCL